MSDQRARTWEDKSREEEDKYCRERLVKKIYTGMGRDKEKILLSWCSNHLALNGGEDLKWSDLLYSGTHEQATASQTPQSSFLLSEERWSSQTAPTLTTPAQGSGAVWAHGAEVLLSWVIYIFCSSRSSCSWLEAGVMVWMQQDRSVFLHLKVNDGRDNCMSLRSG